MADICTYADLRFVKTQKKLQNPGCHQTASRTAFSEDGELMYENFKSDRVSAENPTSGSTERASQAKQGCLALQSWSKCIVYILLMICFILLATCITLGVRFLQVSKELRQVSKAHEQQSSSLSQTIQRSKEALEKSEFTQQKLDQTGKDITRLQLMMNSWNDSLFLSSKAVKQCNMTLKRTSEKQIHTEEELKRIQSHLNETGKRLHEMKLYFADCDATDCCPKGWNLFNGRCVFFSAEKTTWFGSKQHCESRGAQLLQALLKNRSTFMLYWNGRQKKDWQGYWIGKELYSGNEWSCESIKQDGTSQQGYCYDPKRWICEKQSFKIGQPGSHILNGITFKN